MSSKIQTIKDAINSWFVISASKTEETNNGLNMNTLEERVLYSAVPLPVDMAESIDANDVDEVFESAENVFEEVESGLEFLMAEADTTDIVDLSTLDAASTGPLSNEIVFIDQSIEGYQQLVDDVLANATNSQTEIVLINTSQNGVSQITDALRQQVLAGNQFDAIHIVSHGEDGALNLGNETLNNQNIEQYREDFQLWQNALTDDADLLLYGCDVAETEMGEAFVESLAGALDVDVLASDDLTGHADLGGDWVFEFQVGEIESDLIFTVNAQANWQGTLNSLIDPTEFGSTTIDTSSKDGSASAFAAADDGSTVHVFSEDSGTADGADVYAVYTDKFGNEDPAVLISANVQGTQDSANIAISHGPDGGDYVVVWTSDHEDPGGETGVYAKVFNEDGEVRVDEFRIDDGDGRNASVDIDDDGNFVVAWEEASGGDLDGGVFAQVFDVDGNEVGTKQAVNNINRIGFQGNPDVSINNNGEFVVTWDNFDGNGESSIFGRQFSFDVFPSFSIVNFEGNEFEITGSSSAVAPSVSIGVGGGLIGDGDPFTYFSTDVDLADSGVFVVAYTNNVNNDLAFRSLAFDDDGSLLHDFGNVSATTQFDQHSPSVVILEDGNANHTVVFAWEGFSANDNQGVYISAFELGLTSAVPLDPVTFTPVASTVEHFVADDAVVGDQSNVTIATFDEGSRFRIGFEGIRAGEDGFHIIDPQAPANASLPTGMNLSGSTLEDQPYQITAAEFTVGFSDLDSADSFGGVRIETLPASGQLFLAGEPVVAGDIIDVEDIAAGSLVYVPNHDFSGDDSFEFRVNDGQAEATQTNRFDLTIEPVSDEVFAVAGTELVSVTGGESLVNSELVGNQIEQEVAALPDGGHVVVWESEGSIYFQTYDASGDPDVLGPVVGVGPTASLPNASDPAVIALNDGGFVVAYSQPTTAFFGSESVFAQRFFEDGTPNGSSFQVSEGGSGNTQVAGAALSDGGFVLTWQTRGIGNSLNDVVARVFDGVGNSSERFLVNEQTTGSQFEPVVTGLDNNQFVIGWTDLSNGRDVIARIYDAGDIDSGSEFVLGQDTGLGQDDLQLQQLENGRFAAIWVTENSDGGGDGVFARVFEQDGTPVTSTDILVNETTLNQQNNPTIAALDDGGFVAIWESAGTDGDDTGIFGPVSYTHLTLPTILRV